MGQKHIRTNINFGWATPNCCDVGSGRRGRYPLSSEIAEPQTKLPPPCQVTELEDKFANPYVAAERGFIDEVSRTCTDAAKLIALSRCGDKRARNPRRSMEYSALVSGEFGALPKVSLVAHCATRLQVHRIEKSHAPAVIDVRAFVTCSVQMQLGGLLTQQAWLRTQAIILITISFMPIAISPGAAGSLRAALAATAKH